MRKRIVAVSGRLRGERIAALLVAGLLQAVFAIWLATVPGHDRHRPGDAPHQRIRLQWLARPSVPPVPPAPARAAPAPAQARRASASASLAGTADPRPTAAPAASPASRGRLDLSLPAGAIAGTAAPARQPWERPPPVAFQGTRFNDHWTPDGGEIQQTWAFRSRIAATLLAATGALDTPCTAQQRARRLSRCFGAQYPGDTEPPPGPGK